MQLFIQQAPLGVFLAMVGVALAMAAVCVAAGLSARRQAAVVKATKAVAIGMAQNGYHQVEGHAEAIDGQTVTAPLTGSPCVWFSARVEEFRRDASGSNRRADWRTVRSLTSSAPMLVRDATGAATVHVYGAEIRAADKSRWTGGTLEPEDRNPPRFGPMESATGLVEVAGGADSRFRYTEERIYPGDPLTVVGLLTRRREAAEVDDEDDDTDDADPGDDDDPLPASTADAWQTADDERTDTLTAKASAITTASIMKGARKQPLIIAATSADTHVYMSEMGAQAAFMVALVPLGIAALVLLARFG
jgi:hypothetical protein